jgi:tetratricopeptide (TPR) repeat protein
MTLPAFLSSRRAPWWAALAIGVAAMATYLNSLNGPFIFDDISAIQQNETIHSLGRALSPPPGALPVSGRPVVNLSFALNYALSGLNVWSYHLANLLIQALAGITLFGLVRRTLANGRTPFSDAAFPVSVSLAFSIALLWTLHPLQTESVAYTSQRAESLMGLFYLLTLYFLVRGSDAEKAGETAPGRWFGLSCAACFLGMLSKEVMVSAPLMALLYDRTFLSGSFSEAWRRHRQVYLALAGTWILLIISVASAGTTRGGTSGFALGAAGLNYWLTQFKAVAHYLWLALWPRSLVIYYAAFWVKSAGQVVPYALVVIPLAVATGWALWRRPVWGFLGAWFFAILAPTSLVPNSIQMIAEHRMYLPLAAIVAAVVGGITYRAGGRAALLGCAVVGLGYGIASAHRNEAYQSNLAIWSDTVAKQPDNPFAHNDLGEALFERGAMADAVTQFREALRVNPDLTGYINYGYALLLSGRNAEAGQAFATALGLKPGYAKAENGLGAALFGLGHTSEALDHFVKAIRANPSYAEAFGNLGTALASLNRLPEAISADERAVQLNPQSPEAHYSLGNAYYQTNRLPDAVREYEAALRLQPGSAEAYDHYGILLAQVGRRAEAEEQFKQALRLQPDYKEARENLQELQAAEAGGLPGGAPSAAGSEGNRPN